jgi:hypothetical protein
MNPKVIEAARFIATDDNGDDVCAADRARRVLLAQAECFEHSKSPLSADDVMELWKEHGGDRFGPTIDHVCMPYAKFFAFLSAAISAALRFEAGE